MTSFMAAAYGTTQLQPLLFVCRSIKDVSLQLLHRLRLTLEMISNLLIASSVLLTSKAA